MTQARPDHSPRTAEWRDTFTEICDRHRGRLIRWLTSIFGARDAEDIAQETLTRLFTRPGLIEDCDDAWPWLSVVARNVGRDLARHNALSTTVETSRLALVADETRVCDEVLARDEADRVARALRSLAPRERAVIRLRDFEGATITEISELVGINENAVRQQLFRARRRLANVYLDMGGDSRFGALVAAVGLRFRELARRFGPFVNETGAPSAMVLVSALPAVAAAIALGLGVGSGAGTPSAFGREDVRDGGPVERGVNRFSAVGVSVDLGGGPAGGARLPGAGGGDHDPPIIDDHRDIGPAHNDLSIMSGQFREEGGKTFEHEITVDTPIGPVGLTSGGRQDPGHGPVCSSGLVNCQAI